MTSTDGLNATYAYDAFGQREQTVALVRQDFGFTGREFDPETGLYYYRARHYDPGQGRFIQSDPLGFAAGDLNLYAYTWNDPANSSAPSGLAASADKGTLSARVKGLAKNAVVVGSGGVCLAGTISTALTGLGFLVGEDRTFNQITSIVSAGALLCRTKIKSKIATIVDGILEEAKKTSSRKGPKFLRETARLQSSGYVGMTLLSSATT